MWSCCAGTCRCHAGHDDNCADAAVAGHAGCLMQSCANSIRWEEGGRQRRASDREIINNFAAVLRVSNAKDQDRGTPLYVHTESMRTYRCSFSPSARAWKSFYKPHRELLRETCNEEPRPKRLAVENGHIAQPRVEVGVSGRTRAFPATVPWKAPGAAARRVCSLGSWHRDHWSLS